MIAKSAADCFRWLCEPGNRSRVWMRAERRNVTYGELHERILQVAGLAKHCDIKIGDRVVIATSDDNEAALLFVALIVNGITAVNLDADTGPERAAALIARASPRLILLDAKLKARWDAEKLSRCIEIDSSQTRTLSGLFKGVLGTAADEGQLRPFLRTLAPGAPPTDLDPETLAYVMFTSGTTRHPKGVCISHRALFAHLTTLSKIYGLDRESSILNTLMLSHADGMIQGPVLTFFNGITLHRPLSFQITALDALLDSIYRLRVTHMVAVPTMLSLMLRLGVDQRDAFQGGDFKLLISCGAALPPELWDSIERQFNISVLNVYGLTETVVGGVFGGRTVDTDGHDRIGRPIDCQLRVVDDAGVDVAEGQSGELLIRGALLMTGYFEDSVQTREVLRDGWLYTGDVAFRDQHGWYAICGRKKNIVIRGGYNIHPEEVVEALRRDPKVLDAVVFGVPDPDWGETLVALVEAAGTDESALLSCCKQSLEPRKIPSRILLVERLPRGRSGKVSIADARALFERSSSAPGGTRLDTGDREARFFAIAARCFKTDSALLGPTSTPRDVIGWDSLAHMEFIVELENEFDVKFSPREVIGLDSLGKALGRIQSSEAAQL